MKNSRVFVAGTFDGFHKGHQFLLSQAFHLGKQVTIGLTSDTFVRKFKIFNLKFSIRKRNLKRWLKTQGYARRYTIVPIDDPLEPAASFPETVVLLITPDNKHRGEEINKIRKKRRLPPFILIEVPLIVGEDQQPISSTRVRQGEIDAEGHLILPDNLRPQLQQPLGLVLHDDMIARSLAEHKGEIIITVGDVATKTLLDEGVTPSLAVIDNKVERRPYAGLKKWKKTLHIETLKVQSGPGFIAHEAVLFIRQWAKEPRKPCVIEVDGEEDLLALPALAEAPVGAVLYYGQPRAGLVEVIVTKETKRLAVALLGQFTQ